MVSTSFVRENPIITLLMLAFSWVVIIVLVSHFDFNFTEYLVAGIGFGISAAILWALFWRKPKGGGLMGQSL